MEKLLLKTQLAFDSCKQHLETSKTWGSEIESYLTQHILVIMCADVQQEIYRVVENRVDAVKDIPIKNFVVASCKRILRSVGKTEIAGFIGNFGNDAKSHLNQIEEKTVTIYNNAVSNRHDVAHSTGSNITFRELEDAIEAARKLISLASEAISLQIKTLEKSNGV